MHSLCCHECTDAHTHTMGSFVKVTWNKDNWSGPCLVLLSVCSCASHMFSKCWCGCLFLQHKICKVDCYVAHVAHQMHVIPYNIIPMLIWGTFPQHSQTNIHSSHILSFMIQQLPTFPLLFYLKITFKLLWAYKYATSLLTSKDIIIQIAQKVQF